MLHSLDEFGGSYVVEVIVFLFVAGDFCVIGDHVAQIGFEIVADGVAAMAEIGVEHAFELNANSVVPLGLLGEIEQPGLWIALHLGVGHPLGI